MTETILFYNKLARDLVSENKYNPLQAVRVYAMLSTTQYKIVKRKDATSCCIATGSQIILSSIFSTVSPTQFNDIGGRDNGSCSSNCDNCNNDCANAKRIAAKIIKQRAPDLTLLASTIPNVPHLPTEPCKWFGMNPLGPCWPCAKPWVICSPYAPEFGVNTHPPPNCLSSCTFARDLAEVKLISDTRTPEQLAIAERWAGNPGSPTPPGQWNEIAAALVECQRRDAVEKKKDKVYSTRKVAKIFYVLNAAQFDASLVAWAFKYKYWIIRPSQIDPSITTPIGLPNFPSYTSGHSTFSAASAVVLGTFFPKAKRELWSMAKEAGISRIYGGIHYNFDNIEGRRSGRAVGKYVVDKLVSKECVNNKYANKIVDKFISNNNNNEDNNNESKKIEKKE